MQLLSAFANRENVVRLTFDAEPYFSGLLDPGDASVPSHYSVTPVAGSVGADGQPARAVMPVSAMPTAGDPNSLDVTLDRPMSPFRAQYTISVTGLFGPSVPVPLGETILSFILGGDPENPLDPDPALYTFYGCYRVLVRPQIDMVTPSRDIANPQTLASLVGATPYATSAAALGTFVIDSTGDYAIDQGIISYKKRILRRGIVKPGGFKHAPTYGVGIPSYGKKLVSPSLRQKLASEWEQQILLEPETSTVKVTATTDPNYPGLAFFAVAATMKSGRNVNFSVPIPIT